MTFPGVLSLLRFDVLPLVGREDLPLPLPYPARTLSDLPEAEALPVLFLLLAVLLLFLLFPANYIRSLLVINPFGCEYKYIISKPDGVGFIKPFKYIIIPIMVLFFNIMIILYPTETIEAAKQGMLLWYNAALPSLFPFAVGTTMLVGLGFPNLLGRAIRPVSKRLFKLSPGGFFVFLCGMLSGYPIGMKTLAEMYENRLVSREEARRLILFCNNSGPLFVIGSLGAVMLGDPALGIPVLICHYLSAVIIAVFTGLSVTAAEYDPQLFVKKESFTVCFCSAVEKGCGSMIAICGYIVLFSVIIRLIGILGIVPFICRHDPVAEALVLGSLEMTNGCSIIAHTDTALKLPLLCALVSFGGFSVHAQSAGFISRTDLPFSYYIKGKAVSAMLAFLLCLGYVYVFG